MNSIATMKKSRHVEPKPAWISEELPEQGDEFTQLLGTGSIVRRKGMPCLATVIVPGVKNDHIAKPTSIFHMWKPEMILALLHGDLCPVGAYAILGVVPSYMGSC